MKTKNKTYNNKNSFFLLLLIFVRFKNVLNNVKDSNQLNLIIQEKKESVLGFIYFINLDRNYHPSYYPNNPISLPDIRIGLSRHHSTKHLHKTIID